MIVQRERKERERKRAKARRGRSGGKAIVVRPRGGGLVSLSLSACSLFSSMPSLFLSTEREGRTQHSRARTLVENESSNTGRSQACSLSASRFLEAERESEPRAQKSFEAPSTDWERQIRKKLSLQPSPMAESWDSGTRSTVQKLPLLTVRERNAGNREDESERERARERNASLVFSSTPTDRLNKRNRKKKLYPLFSINIGPRRPARRQGGMGEAAQGGKRKRGEIERV